MGDLENVLASSGLVPRIPCVRSRALCCICSRRAVYTTKIDAFQLPESGVSLREVLEKLAAGCGQGRGISFRRGSVACKMCAELGVVLDFLEGQVESRRRRFREFLKWTRRRKAPKKPAGVAGGGGGTAVDSSSSSPEREPSPHFGFLSDCKFEIPSDYEDYVPKFETNDGDSSSAPPSRDAVAAPSVPSVTPLVPEKDVAAAGNAVPAPTPSPSPAPAPVVRPVSPPPAPASQSDDDDVSVSGMAEDDGPPFPDGVPAPAPAPAPAPVPSNRPAPALDPGLRRAFGSKPETFFKRRKDVNGGGMWLNLRCRLCRNHEGEGECESPEALYEHHRAAHGAAPLFVCHFCLAGFDAGLEYHVHVLFEELARARAKEFNCFVCAEEIGSPRRLELHLASSHPGWRDLEVSKNRTFLTCGECNGLTFPDFASFVEHRRLDLPSHVARRPVRLTELTCPAVGCGFNASTEPELVLHSSEAHGSKTPFSCPRCGSHFGCLQWLEKHFISYEFNPKRKCDQCGILFVSKNMSEKHNNRVHLKRRPHVCDVCGKGFETRGNLKLHMEWHEPGKKRREKLCPVCGKNIKGFLKYHIATVHNQEKLRKCQFCQEGFAHFGTLRKHMAKVHDFKAERYQKPCELCGKVFASVMALRRHKYNAHEVKDENLRLYTCSRCDKQYTDKSKLNEHLKAHDGVKPHGCPWCEHRTIIFINLKTHIRLVHKRVVNRVFETDSAGNRTYNIVDAQTNEVLAAWRGES